MKKIAISLIFFLGITVGLVASLPASAQDYSHGNSQYQQGDYGRFHWNGDRAYYYDNENHRHWMTSQQVEIYYQRRDPDYWREHQRDWQRDHDQFDRQWRRDHRAEGLGSGQ